MREIALPTLLAAPVLAATLLAACGPAVAARHRPAEDLLRAGAFDDAERAYRDVLVQSPGDAFAADGVRRARLGWVEKRLADCATQRALGRDEEALDTLLGVVRRERGWMMAPPPFQEEEAAAAQRWVSQRTDALQAARRLLAAMALLDRARDAFFSSEDLARFQFRRQGVVAAGAQHCESLWLLASARSPHFAAFVARYCAHWGVEKHVPRQLAERGRAELVSGVYGTPRVGGLQGGEAAELMAAAERALVASPWHDPHGHQRLAVEAIGGVVFVRNGVEESFVQPYAEQVPYEAMEEYCEWVQVPRFVMRDGVEVTENESRCSTRTRFVTRYRVEPREYRYPGWRYRQTMQARIELNTSVAGLPIRVVRSDEGEEADTAHQVDRPEIGVRPDPLALTPRSDWMRRQVAAVEADLGARLDEAWSSWYCIPADDGPLDAAAEQVFRCLRSRRGSPPPFVDSWFRQHLGTGASEALDLLDGGAANASGSPVSVRSAPRCRPARPAGGPERHPSRRVPHLPDPAGGPERHPSRRVPHVPDPAGHRGIDRRGG
ncbi:MAG: hypothetical protein FJ087_21750, partial [Deltaproteobacteria bacterium]|nr:hypothetical protein [Deltaproteobacteria bacterium]